MNFFEEFSKLSDKDKKEVLDLMKFKMNLENQELRKKIKKYEDPEDLTLMFMYCDLKAKDKIKELQEENEFLKIEIRDLKEQIEDENTYHEEANKWCKEAQELNIRINKAIEYIENDLSHVKVVGKRNRSYLLEILRGE